MRIAIVDARILRDGRFTRGEAVLIEGARISAVVPVGDVPADAARHDLAGGTLVPGFVDAQVNGGGGVLFNDAPTVETIRTLAAAHRRFGTTGLLPTLISDDIAVIRAGIEAVDAAIAAGVPGVLGIHVEGPFLNVRRKGIHDAAKIRPLDEEGYEALTGLARGVTLVTVAPERTTPAMIARLAGAGLVVAAGHTEATYREVTDAIDAGLSGFTHLFNAMSQLGNREPGAVGAALHRFDVHAGLIVDGHHVSPVTLGLALRCKPIETFMLVTDAMPAVGTDLDGFDLQGRRIHIRDGACIDDAGTLAGSHLDMAAAVRNTQRMLGVREEDSLAMASAHPADFLRLANVGRIATGTAADLVHLDETGLVIGTWIGGSYQSAEGQVEQLKIP